MDRVEALAHPYNSLGYWYPRVLGGTNVPMPATVIYEPVDPTLEEWSTAISRGENLSPGWMEDLCSIAEGAFEQGAIFMRTDQTSAKYHFRKTCKLKSFNEIEAQLNFLLLLQYGMMGMPQPKSVVLREFLQLAPVVVAGVEAKPFGAFGINAQLPIGAERRYFVRNEIVETHMPYWPEEAIKLGGETSATDWRERLRLFNYESFEEVDLLTGYAEQAVACLEHSYWSIDFMFTTKGWMLPDAGFGECSEGASSS